MRPTGDGHRRAFAPSVKPRDADAMDAGVAQALDDKLDRNRAEAGAKPKPAKPAEPSPRPEARRGE